MDDRSTSSRAAEGESCFAVSSSSSAALSHGIHEVKVSHVHPPLLSMNTERRRAQATAWKEKTFERPGSPCEDQHATSSRNGVARRNENADREIFVLKISNFRKSSN
jgi:hypothetical protein